MNISRMSFVRPVAVAVVAVGLVGCALAPSSEPAGEVAASLAAQAPASDVAVDQAVETDDDDEVVVEPDAAAAEVEPDAADEEAEPHTTESNSVLGGAIPLASTWSQPFYEQYIERDLLERPAIVAPLIGLLPDTSQMRVSDARLSAESQELLASPGVGPAALIAQAALLGSTDLVNDGSLEPLASVAATTCSFCLYRLEAGYAVHDEHAELSAPWDITLEPGAEVKELSSSQHLLVEFTGQDKGLVMRVDGDAVMVDVPAEGRFLVEMLYAQGQWWVLEVLGPGAAGQPTGP